MWHTRTWLRTLTRFSRLRQKQRSLPARARDRGGPRAAVPRLAAAFDEAEDVSPQSARQYHDHWRRLLDLEWAEEERSVTERLESWSLARLEREGLCLTGLYHRGTGRYYDRLLLRFDTETRNHPYAQPPAGQEHSHRRHEFQAGGATPGAPPYYLGVSPCAWLHRYRPSRWATRW
jgi:hypothetical protein